MRYLWSRVVMCVLCFEAVVFAIHYYYGVRGVLVVREQQQAKIAMQAEIAQTKIKNEDVREQIEAWKESSFLQEKFAREKLALQKEQEIIYYSRK